MHHINISAFKKHPGAALHRARAEPVVIMSRDQPEAMMIGLQSGDLLSEPGTRAALATALFRSGGLSLARSARLAQMPLSMFIQHVSRLGIAVVNHCATEAAQDADTLAGWIGPSRSAPR